MSYGALAPAPLIQPPPQSNAWHAYGIHFVFHCSAEILRRLCVVVCGLMFLPFAILADGLVDILIRRFPNLQRLRWYVALWVAVTLLALALWLWWRTGVTRVCDAYVRADKLANNASATSQLFTVCHDDFTVLDLRIEIRDFSMSSALLAFVKALMAILVSACVIMSKLITVLAFLPAPLLLFVCGGLMLFL